jgi:YfiH family protein
MADLADTRSWIGCEATPPGVVAGVTTRLDGESTGHYAQNNLALHVGDDAQRVSVNREALKARLQAADIQWLQQVHGAVCIRAASARPVPAPEADAVWTDQRGLALAIMTADCVPVLVWDAQGQVVGAAHAGWQGLVNGVLGALVSNMPRSGYGLQAWIGPSIGVEHYEVGEDVWQHFVDYPAGVLHRHPHSAAKRLLDLAAAAEACLTRAGVGTVLQSGLCTFSDPRFYSHRRAKGQATGRMASIVMLT